MNKIAPPIANVLPKEARDHLINATKVRDERQRRIAIDAAIDYVKLMYPRFFKPQP